MPFPSYQCSIQSFIYSPHSTTSNEKTFLQNILVILKHSLPNYQKISKTCILNTTYIAISLACPKFSTNMFFVIHDGVTHLCVTYRGNISSRFFSNSEELLKNLGEILVTYISE